MIRIVLCRGSLTPGQSRYGASGGGATHIATKSGLLYSLENYKSKIIIVAGGGGGANNRSEYYGDGNGGSGGGYIGESGQSVNNTNGYGYGYGTGGTQTTGGKYIWIPGTTTGVTIPDSLFGRAYSHGIYENTYAVQSGGGGGYYGGGSGGHGGAGGGSGYIGNSSLTNKGMYCYNCTAFTATSTKTTSTTCTSATATANCAKQGNGYAKITILSTSG